MKIKSEIEQVSLLKTKAKVVLTVDKSDAVRFMEFTDKPVTVEILVDEDLQRKRLSQISGSQRKKVYALFRDISHHIGDTADNVKQDLKRLYCETQDIELFSLGDCDNEQANDFISWLIEWAFANGVELKDNPAEWEM